MKLAAEWKQKLNELRPLYDDDPALLGETGIKEYILIGDIARASSDMIKYVFDQLQYRDYDRQIEEGFTELCQQILGD